MFHPYAELSPEEEKLREENTLLRAALMFAKVVIESYEMEIRNERWLSLIPASQAQQGTTLQQAGFCQGSLFQGVVEDLEATLEGKLTPSVEAYIPLTDEDIAAVRQRLKKEVCCSACGADFDPLADAAWRWSGSYYEHGHGQAGHFPATARTFYERLQQASGVAGKTNAQLFCMPAAERSSHGKKEDDQKTETEGKEVC